MISKFYKTIHNKYYKFFKFFFFLRYVLVIFLISSSLFLLIPKFIDYEKKEDIIKKFISKNYNLDIDSYSSIKFNVLPLPNLSIKNVKFRVNKKPINLNSKEINLFLNLESIYNYNRLNPKKIYFINSDVFLNNRDVKDFIIFFNNFDKKVKIDNLNIALISNNSSIVKIKKINFSNYGYKRNYLTGEIFDKNFIMSLKNNNQNLNFNILDTGIEANIKFNNKKFLEPLIGSAKINFLNNYLKFDFSYRNKNLEINKSNFKNKDLSLIFDSVVSLKPFFNINSNIQILDIDQSILDKISLEKIINNKNIIKKINGNVSINLKNKRFYFNFIENLSMNLNLEHGRLVSLKKISISGGQLNCKTEGNLNEDYPRINFVCNLDLNDKKKFLKKFSISSNNKKKKLRLSFEGSLNILSKKIYFHKISYNENYSANEQDLKYYKEIFEKILFNENFLNIFEITKIEKFLLEID